MIRATLVRAIFLSIAFFGTLAPYRVFAGDGYTTGRFDLLEVYPICGWSGDLGPKITEGDRQAPEGFYTITPSLMEPNSNLLSRRSIPASRTAMTAPMTAMAGF